MKRYYRVYRGMVHLFTDPEEWLPQHDLYVEQEGFEQFKIHIRGTKGVALIPIFQDVFDTMTKTRMFNTKHIIDICHKLKIYELQ